MHPGSPDGSSEIAVDAGVRGAHESVGERIEHAVEEVFTKPLLRGWLHLVCFFLAIPAGIAVIGLAESVTGRIGASGYAVGLVALFKSEAPTSELQSLMRLSYAVYCLKKQNN